MGFHESVSACHLRNVLVMAVLLLLISLVDTGGTVETFDDAIIAKTLSTQINKHCLWLESLNQSVSQHVENLACRQNTWCTDVQCDAQIMGTRIIGGMTLLGTCTKNLKVNVWVKTNSNSDPVFNYTFSGTHDEVALPDLDFFALPEHLHWSVVTNIINKKQGLATVNVVIVGCSDIGPKKEHCPKTFHLIPTTSITFGQCFATAVDSTSQRLRAAILRPMPRVSVGVQKSQGSECRTDRLFDCGANYTCEELSPGNTSGICKLLNDQGVTSSPDPKPDDGIQPSDDSGPSSHKADAESSSSSVTTGVVTALVLLCIVGAIFAAYKYRVVSRVRMHLRRPTGADQLPIGGDDDDPPIA